MEDKKNEQQSTTENSQPAKEVIKKNSEAQAAEQSKKDTKEKQVEHNYSKEQE